MATFRSEWKYICTDGQLELLRSRLSGVLEPDPHSGPDGSYQIHSLYFDDYRDSCAAGNESGDGIRHKYRVRYYGDSVDTLHLERKSKFQRLSCKKDCPISLREYHSLLRGDAASVFWETDQPLLEEFCTQMMTRYFTPKAIIDYERTAFIEPVTHIRITLDRSISAASDYMRFLDNTYFRVPLQTEHQHVLEVKFDEILPGWLKQMLESMRIQQTAFSKYHLGRKQLGGLL